ncbi:hypothetical protein A6770_27010 [Nostoc minutum NIES-26]|uniref:Uncharacterized protein n=1 Tax=Nostoc minutum NIES-26 TaxID=1844469 RepID=A0A367QPA4_9NOSO|nr:hypothetical protein A6770_27010 [Nostoc minutum NIES-26]
MLKPGFSKNSDASILAKNYSSQGKRGLASLNYPSGDAHKLANATLTGVCHRRKAPSRQRLPFGRRRQLPHDL